MPCLNLDDNEIKRLHDNGLSAQQIAIVMKCSKTTILNHLRKMNDSLEKIHTDAKNGQTHAKKSIPLQDIIDLHEAGFTDKEISERLGCSRSNITIRLNKAGYSNRKAKIDNIELRNKISDSLRGTNLGSENHRYQGCDDAEDLTHYYKVRARGIAKTLKNEVLRNRDNVCIICGETEFVEVHHKKPFQILLDEFLIDAYSGNLNDFSKELQAYEPFMDRNNLIIVCPTCHKKIHLKANPELSQYLLESATTIESIGDIPNISEEVSRVESSDSKCGDA